jgi:molecular chaperone DnaK
MRYHKVIGIDLGTTYSAVSLWDNEEKKIIVIPNPVSQLSTIPSVIGLDPEGKVIVGTQAQNNLVMDPANTVIEIKRLMGTYRREPNPATDDPGEPTTVRFRGRDYLPQEISAFILMELKRLAEHFVGEPIHDAVITCPAYFKEPQKGATADAAAMARLNLKILINEPTAAAVCFGVDKVTDDKRHIYAVYDLGGGTFDVSIVAVTQKSVDVIGTGGDPRLGGGDFDNCITDYALKQIQAKYGVDLSRDPAIKARVKREAEMRKRELAVSAATMLNLPYLTPQISANIPLTRTVFEGLIQNLLQKSLDCLDEAIEHAYKNSGVTRDQIEQVLLVGGSTRVACVRKLLADHLEMDIADVRADIDPDEVVSRGAALVARDQSPSDAYEGKEIKIDMSEQADRAGHDSEVHMVLNDVTSHTLGILVNESDFLPLIQKDSQIPAANTYDGLVNGGPSKEIPVMIFQGENPVAFNNTLIGKMPIILPEARERGHYRFKVTFNLDANGLLSVQMVCLNDNQSWDTKVQCNVRASRQQIEKSAQHLQDAMADGSTATDEPTSSPVGAIPRPPVPAPPIPQPMPTPPSQPATTPVVQAAATVPASPLAPAPQPVAGALPSPPPDLAEKYAGMVRRAFKLASQLPPSDQNQQRLARAYTAFLKALSDNDPDIQDSFDDLSDLYFRCK